MAKGNQSNIAFRLDVTGADAAAREFNKTKTAMDGAARGAAEAGTALQRTGNTFDRTSRKIKAANDNIGKSASTAGTKIAGLSTGMAGLGTAVSSTSPVMSQFSSVLGTAGSAVTGLTSAIGLPGAIIGGGLLAVIGLLSKGTDAASDAQDRLAEKMKETARAIAKLADAASLAAADPVFRQLLGIDVSGSRKAVSTELASLEKQRDILEHAIAQGSRKFDLDKEQLLKAGVRENDSAQFLRSLKLVAARGTAGQLARGEGTAREKAQAAFNKAATEEN